jgi:hypothetical protein
MVRLSLKEKKSSWSKKSMVIVMTPDESRSAPSSVGTSPVHGPWSAREESLVSCEGVVAEEARCRHRSSLSTMSGDTTGSNFFMATFLRDTGSSWHVTDPKLPLPTNHPPWGQLLIGANTRQNKARKAEAVFVLPGRGPFPSRHGLPPWRIQSSSISTLEMSLRIALKRSMECVAGNSGQHLPGESTCLVETVDATTTSKATSPKASEKNPLTLGGNPVDIEYDGVWYAGYILKPVPSGLKVTYVVDDTVSIVRKAEIPDRLRAPSIVTMATSKNLAAILAAEATAIRIARDSPNQPPEKRRKTSGSGASSSESAVPMSKPAKKAKATKVADSGLLPKQDQNADIKDRKSESCGDERNIQASRDAKRRSTNKSLAPKSPPCTAPVDTGIRQTLASRPFPVEMDCDEVGQSIADKELLAIESVPDFNVVDADFAKRCFVCDRTIPKVPQSNYTAL